jgi:hypothetical protein
LLTTGLLCHCNPAECATPLIPPKGLPELIIDGGAGLHIAALERRTVAMGTIGSLTLSFLLRRKPKWRIAMLGVRASLLH